MPDGRAMDALPRYRTTMILYKPGAQFLYKGRLATVDFVMTLPLFRVVLNPRFTRPFYAVPRTSVVRTASG